MPDIRELLILNHRAVNIGKQGRVRRIISGARMAVRRAVLRTARLPALRSAYLAAYRVHVFVARTALTRFEGTRAVYLSAGLGRGEIRPGISDIDLMVIGDWPEKKQFKLMKCLGLIVLTMPLFDKDSIGGIQTWEDLLHINNTDLLLAYSYASAKRQWTLLWGEDVIQDLPDLDALRRAGAAYLDVRRWWGMFVRMAFSGHLTARDEVFRNSIAFKAVADLLRAEVFAQSIDPPPSRVELVRQQMPSADADLQTRLLESEARNFLEMEGDPRDLVMPWLVHRMEAWHTALLETPSFEVVAHARVTGDASERIVSSPVMAHAERMISDAEKKFAGLKTVYLLPCAGILSPDALALCFEFEEGKVPSAAQLRSWTAPHFEIVMGLPQRLSLYVLLERGAYVLDCVFGMELWSNVLMPYANPDVFQLLSQQEFVLRGSPRAQEQSTGWTRVSQELLEEELVVRRGAQERFGVTSRPTSVENLRNLWRFLQLLVMERRNAANEITIPVTIAATRRTFGALAPELADDLHLLEQALRDAVDGKAVAADDAIQRVDGWTRAQGLADKAKHKPGEETPAAIV